MAKRSGKSFWPSPLGQKLSADINKKIKLIFSEAQTVHDVEKVLALKVKLLKEVGAICHRAGIEPPNWMAIRNRACRQSQNLSWPRRSEEGALVVSKAQVLKLAKEAGCQDPPAVISPAARLIIREKSGLNTPALNNHLRCIGYSAPRVTDEVRELIRTFFTRAQALDSKEETDLLKTKLREQVAIARKKIGQPPMSWVAIITNAQRQEPKVPGWPRRPLSALVLRQQEQLIKKENPHWEP